MTKFVDMSDDDVCLMMQQNHEFMSLIRIIAANSATIAADRASDLPKGLLEYGNKKILEGEMDDVAFVSDLFAGFVVLLKRHKLTADLFEACAKVSPEDNMVRKTARHHEERSSIREKKFREKGVEITDIPGVGSIVTMGPDAEISEIMKMIFGEPRRRN